MFSIDPTKPPQTDKDWQQRIYDALDAFSPGAPIDDLNLIAGRTRQIDSMVETVMQRGQHAILYGERGVGKSSLANTFATKLLGGVKTLNSVPINCHPSDDFTQVWRKVFRRLSSDGANLADKYQAEIHPDDVVVELGGFSLNTVPIIILDEFDKLRDHDARTLIANTIKNMSDRAVRATVIIVGVADSVSDLIEEHESVLRCLRQIPMQRMVPDELRQIINGRLPALGMKIHQDALAHIVALSRGLPHYTHLFGQQSAKKALEDRQLVVDVKHVEAAMPECINQTAQTVREQYHRATISQRQGNIYREVLLSAALAQVDDLGYFQPVALSKPLTALLKREAPVSLYAQHLKNLSEDDRGKILEQIGTDRRFRYRFAEPLMQPYILMHGLRNGLITREQVNTLAATHYEPRLSTEF
ncbi:MAG: orc1/cdc6 family replication initiation protein [Alphaproteobacteria bacterium]|nr:orc1/cdc6 family replication initiation protein [Alphaproteobacteria bacterium]